MCAHHYSSRFEPTRRYHGWLAVCRSRAVHWRIGTILSALAASVFTAEALAEGPATPALAELIGFCNSRSTAEAAEKADQLGWQRVSQSDPKLRKWRTGFILHNSGSVDVVAWRAPNNDNGQLSFWVTQGPNSYRACYYSTAATAGLLDALSEHFGAPTTLDNSELATVATWKQGSIEISFSKVGSTAGFYMFSH